MMSGYIKSCYSNGKDSLEDDEVLYIVCVSNFKRCMFEAIDLYRRSITKNMKRFKNSEDMYTVIPTGTLYL